MKITEVSISWKICRHPTTPIDDNIILMVDPRGKDIERAIHITQDKNELPEWILQPKANNLKFIYNSPLQKIECMYYSANKVFKCSKIKYANVSKLYSCLNNIFNIMRTEPIEIVSTKYKATEVIYIEKPWIKEIFAEIVTNDPRVSQVAALCEQISTIKERRLFLMAIDVNNCIVRVSLTASDKDKGILVMISKVEDINIFQTVLSILKEIFEIYNNSYKELRDVYKSTFKEIIISKSENKVISGIKMLRQEVPLLFISNYTRECPVLPIIISEKEAKQRENVIYYYGRYYTAPDGYYVGLKKNRLKNNNLFPCLITCYLSNHMEKPGSETYNYYKDTVNKEKKASKIKDIPKFLIDHDKNNYIRIKSNSFTSALEVATEKKIDIDNLPWYPQLVKQELWNETDDNIMKIIKSDYKGSLTFRYFEELLQVSIHVIVIQNGQYQEIIPDHIKPYIWDYPYDSHVVIFENTKSIYGNTHFWYDVLAVSLRGSRQSTKILPTSDPLVSSIIFQKFNISLRPPEHESNLIGQFIDDQGKCRIIVLSDGSQQMTLTRPLLTDVIDKPVCFYESNANKLNKAKEQMGISILDLNKQSNKVIKFFPNNESFKYWINGYHEQ